MKCFLKNVIYAIVLEMEMEMEAFPEESAFAGGNPWAAPSG